MAITVAAFYDFERPDAIEHMRERQRVERDAFLFGVEHDPFKQPHPFRVIKYTLGIDRMPAPGEYVSLGVKCVARMALNVRSLPLRRVEVPAPVADYAREVWAA